MSVAATPLQSVHRELQLQLTPRSGSLPTLVVACAINQGSVTLLSSQTHGRNAHWRRNARATPVRLLAHSRCNTNAVYSRGGSTQTPTPVSGKRLYNQPGTIFGPKPSRSRTTRAIGVTRCTTKILSVQTAFPQFQIAYGDLPIYTCKTGATCSGHQSLQAPGDQIPGQPDWALSRETKDPGLTRPVRDL